jgi:calcium-dependent protein kinase
MGCYNSKPKKPTDRSPSKDKYEVQEEGELYVKPPVANATNFQISVGDFIITKKAKFRDDFEVREQLGSGAYGEVRKVVHKKSRISRAAKIISKDAIDKEEQEKLMQEVRILSSLDHPNIMRIFEIFEEKGKYIIISELLEGGELFERISDESFSERDAAKIMKQVFSAVVYCHKHGVVHRDLKPENLVYDSKKKEANLKVIDFGTARIIKPDQKLHETYGTAYYMAPEVLAGNYTEKCDIWSCGVILFILLSGAPPFPGGDDKEILKNVKIGKFGFEGPVWDSVTPEVKVFIKKLMEVNPDKRYDAQQALLDPWFVKIIEKEEMDKTLAKENLTRLKNLKFESKLQEATWAFLVNYFSTKEEKEKLLKTFKQLDINDDGELTHDELIQGFIRAMGMTPQEAKEEVDRIMKNFDANQSGSMDYSEFVNGTINRTNILTKERLEAAFKLFDKDGDGSITADEMRVLFNQGKTQGIPENVWKNWIKEVDANGDGGISLKEFKDMMLKLKK